MNGIKSFFIGDLFTSTTSPYEKAKIEVNFTFSLYSFIGFASVFIVVYLIGANSVAIPTGFSALFCLAHLIVLRTTKNVRVAGILFSFAIFTVIFGNLFFNTQTLHLGTILWIVVLILFVTFNFGRKIGLFASLFCVLFYTLFIFTKLPAHIALATTFDPSIYYSIGAEIFIGIGIILYLIDVFIETNYKITNELKVSNKNLEKQNLLIQKQFREKDIMMKEIHHRVKNNLQIINSMLRLQSAKIDLPQSQEVFSEAQNRIQAMAAVHERMYQSEDLSNVKIESYLRKLCVDFIAQYSINQEVELVVSSSVENIDVQRLVPLGLILNELVSNSLKHGIDKIGKIEINLSEKDHQLLFSYSDNGKGMPTTIKNGFGIELIEIFTDQLDGELTISTKNDLGVVYTFIFKNE